MSKEEQAEARASVGMGFKSIIRFHEAPETAASQKSVR